jgi:uncharacterized membrane protein
MSYRGDWIEGAEDRWGSASPPPPPPPEPEPEPRLGLEDFLGGRVLGWAGAATVLLGVVLLVAVAIGRGWIDEPTRIALAFAGSAGMLTVGAWLYERRGGTQASLLIAGTGLAAMYLTLTAGIQLYGLYPAPLALLEAALIGLVGTVLAVRWNSRTVAALSIGGALLAPRLVGAEASYFVTGFILITLACAVGVLTLRRWNWLAVGCFVVAAPQLLAWVAGKPGPLALTAALSAYALVNAGAALGYELRVKSEGLRPSSTLLVLAGGLVTAAGGYYGLRLDGYGTLAEWWVAAVAAAHLGAGIWAMHSSRVGREIALVTVGAGTVLADIAFGTIAHGPVVAAGWAASAAALALIARRGRRDVELTRLALGGQLTLALGHVLLFDASPQALISGVHDLPAALVGIASVGITCFIVARLDGTDERIAAAYDTLAIVALAYGTAYALDGPALVAAWAGTGAALAGTVRRDRLGLVAAVGFVAMAGLHALAYEAPLGSLGVGVTDLAGAAAALAAVAGGCIAIARQLDRPEDGPARTGLQACAAVALLYLASVAVVTVFQPSADTLDAGFALGARAQGQVLLSGLWAAAGALALVIGLRRDRLEMRIAGFALLALAFGKVIVFDLSTLDSIYRVASCVALGLLLLGSAFAYQRMRPRMGAR